MTKINTSMARLEEKYNSEIAPALQGRFGYKNLMQAPRLKKIVINMGLGEAIQNVKVLDAAVDDLMKITGQRPVITRARKSIANFKLRSGMPIGCKVTIRGRRMYEFLDRLLSAVLPRIRDFKGISGKAFDGHGNYAMGLKEQIVFPEIDYDKIDKVRGMDVIIVTTAKSDDEARELLQQLGMPFRMQ
jgi:large subunit ribosomal protein L5